MATPKRQRQDEQDNVSEDKSCLVSVFITNDNDWHQYVVPRDVTVRDISVFDMLQRIHLGAVEYGDTLLETYETDEMEGRAHFVADCIFNSGLEAYKMARIADMDGEEQCYHEWFNKETIEDCERVTPLITHILQGEMLTGKIPPNCTHHFILRFYYE